MKKMLFISLAICLAVACGKVDDEYYQREKTTTTDPSDPDDPDPIDQGVWYEPATLSTDNMIATFWKQTSGNWFFQYGDGANNHYWPQAHAMDVVIDAYIRTEQSKYLSMYSQWFDGVRKGGNWSSQNWRNPYIDDMEWIVLTQIRMYETTLVDSYLTTAKQIYNDWIITEWSETPGGGGILWCTSTTPSKNACSNGPAALIACKLYNLTPAGAEKEKYKSDAIKIYTWLRAALFNTDGSVSDNINNNNQKTGGALTYNQGTFLGSAHELYKITGLQSYLDDAILAADYTTTRLITNGILRNEGTGDNELFKGIFIRYFVKLANDTHVAKAKRQTYHTFMQTNATMAWESGASDHTTPFYSPDWSAKPTGTNMLNRNVSACTLLEGINALKPIE